MSIIEFSVENYRIFKERVVFSMVAHKSEHTFLMKGKENLLRTSLIFGPNASGKSSLKNALQLIKKQVLNSTNFSENSKVPYNPFLMSNEEKKPSFFEIIFCLDKKIFKYNFSLSKTEVVEENLFKILTKKEECCFQRRGQEVFLGASFLKSKDVKEKTRKEVLFLSAAAQWNNKLAMEIVESFRLINGIDGSDKSAFGVYTLNFVKNDLKKAKVLEYLKAADFSIEGIVVEKMILSQKEIEGFPFKETLKEVETVFFNHKKFSSLGKEMGTERLNIGQESLGTQRFFDILGPIIDTLEQGKVLFIDEFDSSLHPLLTKFILDLFEKKNPNNAQLIVTTHDTSLLGYKEFNKEQFWFTEKDRFGAGTLFCLSEFDLRNSTEYSKKYFEGRFGALPFINFENLK